MFFEILKAVLLGLVEGITEWLPISSTGHMILVDAAVKLNAPDAFKDMFFVVIQLGAVAAVVCLFFHRLNPFSRKKTPSQRRETWSLWGKVLVASVPAGVAGILLDDAIDGMLTGAAREVIVAAALIVYGILFIVIENRHREPVIGSVGELNYRAALLIGVFQMLALVPGTSRSGSTILGAMLLGVARPAAAEFSFFMAIPAMAGGSALKVVKFFAGGNSFTGGQVAVLLVGTAVAFLVSLFAVKFLMNFIRRHSFKPFGVYRIALGSVVLLYTLIRSIAA